MADNPKDDKKKDDELLARVRRLQEQTGGVRDNGKDDGKSGAKSAEQNMQDVLKTAQRASKAFNQAATVWDAVTTPLRKAWEFAQPTVELGKHAAIKTGEALSFLKPVGRPLWNGYKALFNRMAYTKDDNGARTILHKPRALGAVALTALAAYMGVTQGLPFAGNLTYDAVMMAATTQQDVPVYLTGANPSDDTDDVFYVKGCEELPCTDRNSVYYRLRDNAILSVYRFATTGKGFWPEDVGSAIPEETSLCKIDQYGIRIRALGMYPHITAVSGCTPITQIPGAHGPAAQVAPQP
jgi:hypothetical protein